METAESRLVCSRTEIGGPRDRAVCSQILLAGLLVAVGTVSSTHQSAGSVLMLDERVGVRVALLRFISIWTPLKVGLDILDTSRMMYAHDYCTHYRESEAAYLKLGGIIL
jgi:hypothetical protein